MHGSVFLVHFRNAVTVAATVLLLSGCLLEEEVDSESALTISGNPAIEVNANNTYEFTPTASGPDGESLSFSIFGLPGWADFDPATGQIIGTPGDADVGTYSGIEIMVSSEIDSATFGPFTITVQAMSLGSVSLSWDPPTQNSDGSVLDDLAGYKIYWGTSAGNYSNSARIDNPSISTYFVENLPPGTYQFVATSLSAAGVESEFSNLVTKEVL